MLDTVCLKCNYDAAFDPIMGQVVGGWILRDHFGVAKLWGLVLGDASPSIEAYGKAIC